MADIKSIAYDVCELLQAKGVEQFSYEVSESEKQELNTENTEFALFRTTFDNSIELNAYINGKKGFAAGNDLTKEGLEKVVQEAILSAQSAASDAANGIAEDEGKEVFTAGPLEADMDKFYDRMEELLCAVTAEFPKIKVLQSIGDHTKNHVIYINSNGTEFEKCSGAYHVSLEFSGNDGEKTTGLSYVRAATEDLDKPFMEVGTVRKHFEDAEASLNVTKISGKFEGTVIFTPECLARFAFMTVNNFASGSGIMDGTARWADKIGEQVSSERVTLTLKAEDDRLVGLKPYTADGYKAENVTILEKGVLKSHLMNLYQAKKTGRPVTKNDSMNMVMEPGNVPVDDMIASVKKGMIVGGFSGGRPGANGEFSGVAKNSFYVEDGKIVGAVNETMINGNLEDVFKNVIAVSSELTINGGNAFPYMAVSGIVISGK